MIQFDKGTHTYTIDGVRTPSVTQILSWLYPRKYADVPPEVLKEKAEYGNRVHEWIENYCLTGKKKRQSKLMRLSTEQAISLLEGFDVEACEKAVSFGNKFCGTYDMYGECDGEKVLIDIKTTSEFDEEYLQWQLGMYKLAMEEHGDQVDKCMCLWLPKGKIASLKDVVPKTRYDIEWLLYRYEEEFTDK